MKRLLYPLMLCAPVCLLAQTPASAPASPVPNSTLTTDQTANIMKQLDQIEAQITKGRGDLFSNALAKCRAGAASEAAALSLYLDCYKIEHFDKRNLKTTDFQAWKENNPVVFGNERDANALRLKDEEFAKGLILQLEYLVLSIQAQEADEDKERATLVASVQAFLPRAINAVQDTMKHTASGAIEGKGRGGRGGRNQLGSFLNESVKQSVIAKALQVDEYLRSDEWEYTPLNIDGIYEAMILPFCLQNKSGEIPVQWDSRISAELALKKCSMSEAQYAEFYKEKLPVLQWEKATYMLKNKVSAITALADMLKIVRENPSHANSGQWVKQLRQSVNELQAPVISPGADPAAPEPAPTTQAATVSP